MGFQYLKPSLSLLQALIRAGPGSGLNGLGSAGSGLEARPSTSLTVNTGVEIYEALTITVLSVLVYAHGCLYYQVKQSIF